MQMSQNDYIKIEISNGRGKCFFYFNRFIRHLMFALRYMF